MKSKLIALGFLVISLIGSKGKKDEKLSNFKTAFAYMHDRAAEFILSAT
jgi:hypothetical protein